MTTDAFDARDVFATKADLFATRAELKDEIAALRVEVKEEIGELRAEIHQMEARLLRWMTGAVLGGMIAAATITRLTG